MQSFAEGAPVWMFYRLSRQPEARRFLACPDRQAGIYRPRVGLAEGWIPAAVERDFDPAGFDPGDPRTWIHVRPRWPHLYDRRGAVADLDRRGEDRLLPAHVAPRSGAADRLVRPSPAPEVGLIVVRWGGRPIVSAAEWGSTGSSASDTYVAAFLQLGLVEALGLDGRYEVWTVYVEDASDLDTLADSAHLIFGNAHPIRRARRVKAAFFLYHTGFDLRFISAFEAGGNEGAGYVDRQPYRRMIQAFERAGIRTEHPHASHLYETLAGKSWQHALCLDPALRVPAAVAVPRGDIESDLEGSVRDALLGLEAVRRAQHRRGLVPVGLEEEDDGHAVDRGVVKLGYSWEALYVKHWRGAAGLHDALYALTRNAELRGTLAGQPHDGDPLIVQEFVPHDCELRLYFVEGVCELVLATKMEPGDDNDFGALVHCTAGEARYRFFRGDDEAFEEALRRCRALSRSWLDWLVVENGGKIPPAIRFDFVVRRTAAGAADVRTLEICEQGFSWLRDETLPPKVFAAVARSCVDRRVPFAPHQVEGGEEAAADAATAYSRRPAARSTVRLVVTGDGALAFDAARESVHRLNRDAALALALCDGRHEVEEIGAAVGAAGSEPFDLDAWLVEAVTAELVGFGRSEAPGRLETDGGELARLVEVLREAGETEVALECERRATEASRGRKPGRD